MKVSNEKYILLLDPALQNHSGTPSANIGDQIIYESVRKLLEELFPGEEIRRISTHQYFTAPEKELINNARYTFVGGSNILTADIRNFPRLSPVKRKGFYFFPGFRNIILLGTGWSGYERPMDWPTKVFYKKVLHKKIEHSIRDHYSLSMMKKCGLDNFLFTGCPTTWNLPRNIDNRFNPSLDIALMMLSHYYQDRDGDNRMTEEILTTGAREIYFFPPSAEDVDYLNTLPAYQKNKPKFKIIKHSLEELNSLLTSVRVNHIGTRLHGGIKSLAYGHPTAIIGVDNRAIEMGKSMKLNVIERNDIDGLRSWISGQLIPEPIVLPDENIKRWKNQFH